MHVEIQITLEQGGPLLSGKRSRWCGAGRRRGAAGTESKVNNNIASLTGRVLVNMCGDGRAREITKCDVTGDRIIRIQR
jgi:hypothetical protein